MLQDLYSQREENDIKDCFRSDGYIQGVKLVCDDASTVDMADIPPFLRTILITDGTVTKSLEAFYWEPVVVDREFQYCQTTEHAIAWLKTQAGDELLLRGVRLRGEHTGNCYATAFSALRLHLLPTSLREGLLSGSLGIGQLIRDSGLETYRQILEIGIKKQHYGQINIHQSAGFFSAVFRTYRIVIAHEPAIIITETFPWPLYG